MAIRMQSVRVCESVVAKGKYHEIPRYYSVLVELYGYYSDGVTRASPHTSKVSSLQLEYYGNDHSRLSHIVHATRVLSILRVPFLPSTSRKSTVPEYANVQNYELDNQHSGKLGDSCDRDLD